MGELAPDQLGHPGLWMPLEGPESVVQGLRRREAHLACSWVQCASWGFSGAVLVPVQRPLVQALKYDMELTYSVTQSPVDRLTFILKANLTPAYNGTAIGYADSLVKSGLTAAQRERAMKQWLEYRAKLLLDTHPIGKWCREPHRSKLVVLDLKDAVDKNIIRLRFISASEAMLFKLTFT